MTIQVKFSKRTLVKCCTKRKILSLILIVLFNMQVSTEEPVACKSCRKTFSSSEMIKQHVQNVIHQQMNTTGPVHVKTGQSITKTVPVAGNKQLNGGRDRFISPVEVIVGVQENQRIVQRITKTVIGVGNEQFDHGRERYAPQADLIADVQENQMMKKESIDVQNANTTSPRMKIIQESPVIDKNGGVYESECKPTVNGISSNSSSSDINGNSDEGITERVEESCVIETNSGEGMTNGHKISLSSPNLDFNTLDSIR